MPYFENITNCGPCPHEDAFQPDGVKPFYRVVKHNPVTSDCFLPTPVREGFEIDPCISKSVSIYDSLDGIRNGYSKTPALKNKQGFIATMILRPEDGMLKKTFSNGHHSWWRSNEFSIETVIVQIVGP
ncbi:MAG TPA: hypothetical protein VF974_07265 [Patescibacteria group bacterium]